MLRKTPVIIGMAKRGMKKRAEFRDAMVEHLTSNQEIQLQFPAALRLLTPKGYIPCIKLLSRLMQTNVLLMRCPEFSNRCLLLHSGLSSPTLHHSYQPPRLVLSKALFLTVRTINAVTNVVSVPVPIVFYLPRRLIAVLSTSSPTDRHHQF